MLQNPRSSSCRQKATPIAAGWQLPQKEHLCWLQALQSNFGVVETLQNVCVCEILDLGDYFIYILYFPNTLHLTTACNSRGRPLLPSCVLGARTRATCSRKAAGPPHLRILISSWCANFVVLRSCSVQNLRTTSCSCRHCWKIRLLG